MSGTRSSWKLAVPALVVALPLGLYAAGALRGRIAHAQGDSPGRPTAEQLRPTLSPGETELTPEQENALDVKTVVARKEPGRDHPIVTGGKVSLDLERTARIRPILTSTIFEVKKRAGDEVKKGDELLVVESTDLGDAKNNYLTALASLDVAEETYKRETLLRERRATTEADYFAARAAWRTAAVSALAARQRCLLLGVVDQELKALEAELPSTDAPGRIERSTPANEEEGRKRARYTIRAPIDGVLIAKDCSRGELVDPSEVIATVSDLRQVWINLDVYQRDLSKVRIGEKVTVTTPSWPDIAFVGSITFLSETVDDTTHTLKARVVVANDRGLLKSGMAARTVIHATDLEPHLELPPEAVVREGEETFVVVKRAPGRYARVKVKLGFEAQDSVHVDEGLKEGDVVVLEGNLFIHTKIPLGD